MSHVSFPIVRPGRAAAIVASLVLAGWCGLAGCSQAATRVASRQVVASFYPLAYAAKRVAPAGTEVLCLTPAGVEPHHFELTAKDAQAVLEADLVVYAAGMQPALDRLLARRRGPSLDVLSLPGLRLLRADGNPFDPLRDRAADPHVWLDPQRFVHVAEGIAAALGADAEVRDLRSELAALDAEMASGLAHCARRSLVTTHAAFGYIADRYRLQQQALTGFTPEFEPSPGDLARLVAVAQAEGSRAVFVEPLVSPAVAQLVADKLGAVVLPLDPLEVQLGPSYLEVMRVNLAHLRQGLECSPSSSSSGSGSASAPTAPPS